MEREARISEEGLLLTGFTLGAAAFGIDARLVEEVVKVGEVTPVHDAPFGVVGVRNLRGRLVTVVDLATHLGVCGGGRGPDSRLLIMERQGESFGFLVDAVTDAFGVEDGAIAEIPPGTDPAIRERLLGVWRRGEKLTAVLDPERLFSWTDADGAAERA